MKPCLMPAIAGLAIGFAVPSIAQSKSTVDPQERKQIEIVDMKLEEAHNRHDAAAVAALYTQDAIQVWNWEATAGGAVSGREAIEKRFASNFASSSSELSGRIVQMYSMGNQISAISEWSTGPWKGYTLKVFVRDADTWKIRIEYATAEMTPR